eukprot:gene14025-16529_t
MSTSPFTVFTIPKTSLHPKEVSFFSKAYFLLMDANYEPIFDERTGEFLRHTHQPQFHVAIDVNGSPVTQLANRKMVPPMGEFRYYRLGYKTNETSSHIYRIPLFAQHLKQIVHEAHLYSLTPDTEISHNSLTETSRVIFKSKWYWHFLNMQSQFDQQMTAMKSEIISLFQFVQSVVQMTPPPSQGPPPPVPPPPVVTQPPINNSKPQQHPPHRSTLVLNLLHLLNKQIQLTVIKS